MKFGLHYQLPCYGSQSPVQRYRDTLEQSVHAEALGFESVWPVEQHFNADLSITPAPLLLLAALAERTRTLRLGIAIVLLPLSHPLRVAEEIATLDVLSNGRVEFGIGRGAIPTHFAGFGVPQAESRERFVEALEVIVQAWTKERVSHAGRFFKVDNLSVVPKPVQQASSADPRRGQQPRNLRTHGPHGLSDFCRHPDQSFSEAEGDAADLSAGAQSRRTSRQRRRGCHARSAVVRRRKPRADSAGDGAEHQSLSANRGRHLPVGGGAVGNHGGTSRSGSSASAARPTNRPANRWRFSTRRRPASSDCGARVRNSTSGA